jgi:hypothetical protein
MHNADNVEKLAEHIVESWDLETLQSYALANLANFYMNHEDAFQREWEEEFED